MNVKHVRWNTRIILSAGVVALVLFGGLQASASFQQSTRVTTSQLELRQDMRKLWEDHITWTRVYIIAALADAPDASAAATRLLQNQDDLGDLFGEYYGETRGDQLASLLRVHITTAVDVIAAAKAGDATALTEANNRWAANAEEIAVYLNGLNPLWSLEDLRMMLNEHLELTTDEVVKRLAGDWTGDVAAYDAVHDSALMMADAFSIGIIDQYPKLFRGGK
jgi:hypothetical protein